MDAASTERLQAQLVKLGDMMRGGIIGSVELVDSLDHSDSPWYMGEKGFLLRDPKPSEFIPLKGRLGFFDVPHLAAEDFV